MHPISTISGIVCQEVDPFRAFGSVVRALDFYPGDQGSNHFGDMGFLFVSSPPGDETIRFRVKIQDTRFLASG